VASDEEPDQPEASPAVLTAIKTAIADENVDDLFAEAGRQVGEGLHKEYLLSGPPKTGPISVRVPRNVLVQLEELDAK
jgi:hypothetical protein